MIGLVHWSTVSPSAQVPRILGNKVVHIVTPSSMKVALLISALETRIGAGDRVIHDQ